jgi:uncharacterized Ntn-hydrolase superfamily protein
MTLLNREDPSRLHRIEGDISLKIQQALVSQGLLNAVDEEFSKDATNALREWVNTNNFENKWREDGTIWQSVLDYLLEESNIRRM